jgi:hypothetical protein
VLRFQWVLFPSSNLQTGPKFSNWSFVELKREEKMRALYLLSSNHLPKELMSQEMND